MTGYRPAMPDRSVPLTGAPGKAILAVVDKAIETRWDDAREIARKTPGRTIDEKVDAITESYVRQLTLIGAAAGGTAAAPGVGTLAALGAIGAEIAAFAFKATEMIVTIGAAYGHTEATPEQLRSWVLSVLAYGDNAAAGFAETAGMLGAGATLEIVNGASASWFHTVNRYLGRKVLTRFGARKGASTLTKLLPFGIGAVLGAATNLATAKLIARNADRFFKQLPAALHALP